ncbi:MAG: membrane protein insertase YidC [Flexilinea sp.]|nr:membrane protein insertase YidC [Flexilinea sp.]
MWTSFVNLFLNLLLFIYKIVGNFGLAIIIFTVLIKLITHPLMQSQIKSSKAMTELQTDPEYLEMMEKYKNDKERLAQEQMKLYQKKGVNPTASCLPTFIQLPIIFALYQAVIAAIVSTPLGMVDLIKRVIPSWIKVSEVFPINPNFLWMNLGMPERLYIGNVGIPVLAILVLLTTILQTKLTQPETPKDDKAGASAAMMTGMMNIYMPLLMGFMAYSLASGLALYFLVSNIFTICQYAVLGTLHWENLKFWEKKKPAPKSQAKRRSYSTTAPAKKEDEAASADKPAVKSESKPKASSSKSDDDSAIFSQKIDYREFKNHKKPKKNKS